MKQNKVKAEQPKKEDRLEQIEAEERKLLDEQTVLMSEVALKQQKHELEKFKQFSKNFKPSDDMKEYKVHESLIRFKEARLHIDNINTRAMFHLTLENTNLGIIKQLHRELSQGL